MTITQLLAPSLAAGLMAAGLGVGTISAPGVAEASGLRSIVSPALSTTAASAETARLFSNENLCTVIWLMLKPGLTPEQNDQKCLSVAPSPADQNLRVAMVFGS